MTLIAFYRDRKIKKQLLKTTFQNPNYHQCHSLARALTHLTYGHVMPRELKAIDSENANNLQNDMWRSVQLTKSLAAPDHPFHKVRWLFGWLVG